MKKVSLDMMLGRRTRSIYKKTMPKTIIVSAILPSGAANKTQIAVLGQYGINTEEFCNVFNNKSETLWKLHMLVPIAILINPSKSFLIEYKIPTVYSLFKTVFKFRTMSRTYFFKPNNKKLLVATAYKIAIIKAQTTDPQVVRKYLYQVLSTFRSFNPFSYFRFSKPKFNFRKKIKNFPKKK